MWGRYYDVLEEQKLINASIIDMYQEEARIAAKKAAEKARNRGLKAGVKEGIREGKKEGRFEKEREMVINFYKQNVSLEIISKASGLTIEEIQKMLTVNEEKN